MQPVVINAIEVRNFMHESDVYLLMQLVGTVANIEERFAVYDDSVWHLAETVLPSFGQRHSVVESKRVQCSVFGPVFDNKDYIVESVDHFVGQKIELFNDETLEFIMVKLKHPLSIS